jgi:hypothetical protein
MRNVSDRSCTEDQNTRFMFNNLFRKSCPLKGVGQDVIEIDRATDDDTIWRMRISCLKRDTLRICNNYSYFFPKATKVTRTRRNVAFMLTLPFLFLYLLDSIIKIYFLSYFFLPFYVGVKGEFFTLKKPYKSRSINEFNHQNFAKKISLIHM